MPLGCGLLALIVAAACFSLGCGWHISPRTCPPTRHPSLSRGCVAASIHQKQDWAKAPASSLISVFDWGRLAAALPAGQPSLTRAAPRLALRLPEWVLIWYLVGRPSSSFLFTYLGLKKGAAVRGRAPRARAWRFFRLSLLRRAACSIHRIGLTSKIRPISCARSPAFPAALPLPALIFSPPGWQLRRHFCDLL